MATVFPQKKKNGETCKKKNPLWQNYQPPPPPPFFFFWSPSDEISPPKKNTGGNLVRTFSFICEIIEFVVLKFLINL
jgi:hypothetical protein